MNNITISQIKNIEDINILHNKSSNYEQFTYGYEEDDIEKPKSISVAMNELIENELDYSQTVEQEENEK